MTRPMFIAPGQLQDLTVNTESSIGRLTNDDVQRLVKEAVADPESEMGRVPPAAPVVYIVAGVVLYGGKEKLDKERKDNKDNKDGKDQKDQKDNKDSKDGKDVKDTKDQKDQKDGKDMKDAKDQKDAHDNKDGQFEAGGAPMFSPEEGVGETAAAPAAQSAFSKLLSRLGVQ